MLWLVLLVAFLFTGMDGKPLPAPVVVFGVGATLFSLVALGRKWPWFGLFLAMVFYDPVCSACGGRHAGDAGDARR